MQLIVLYLNRRLDIQLQVSPPLVLWTSWYLQKTQPHTRTHSQHYKKLHTHVHHKNPGTKHLYIYKKNQQQIKNIFYMYILTLDGFFKDYFTFFLFFRLTWNNFVSNLCKCYTKPCFAQCIIIFIVKTELTLLILFQHIFLQSVHKQACLHLNPINFKLYLVLFHPIIIRVPLK